MPRISPLARTVPSTSHFRTPREELAAAQQPPTAPRVQETPIPALTGGWVSETSLLNERQNGAAVFRNVVVTEDGEVVLRTGYEHRAGVLVQASWQDSTAATFTWTIDATFEDFRGWHAALSNAPAGIETGLTGDTTEEERSRWFKTPARGDVTVTITGTVLSGGAIVRAFRTKAQPTLARDWPTWSQDGITYDGGGVDGRTLQSGEALTITFEDMAEDEYFTWHYLSGGTLTYLAQQHDAADEESDVYVQKQEVPPNYVLQDAVAASSFRQALVVIRATGKANYTRLLPLSANMVLATNTTGADARVLQIGDIWTVREIATGVGAEYVKAGPGTRFLPFKLGAAGYCLVGAWDDGGTPVAPSLLTIDGDGIHAAERIVYRKQNDQGTVARPFEIAHEDESLQPAIIALWTNPFIYRRRFIWAERNSLNLYASPPRTPFGTYELASFEGQFDRSSTRIVWAGPLSQDTAEGGREIFVAISDSGSILTYTGDIGGNDFAGVGRYDDLPRPLNDHAVVKVGGDVLVATGSGLYSVTSQIQTRGGDVRPAALSVAIDKQWRLRVAKDSTQWRFLYDQTHNWLVCFHPTEPAMVYQIGRKVWSEFKPYNFTDAVSLEGHIVSTQGKERLLGWNRGGNDDSAAYTAIVRSAFFSNYGLNEYSIIHRIVAALAYRGAVHPRIKVVGAFSEPVVDGDLVASRSLGTADALADNFYWADYEPGDEIPAENTQRSAKWANIPLDVSRDAYGFVIRAVPSSRAGFGGRWQWYDYRGHIGEDLSVESFTQKLPAINVQHQPLVAVEVQLQVQSQSALLTQFQGFLVMSEQQRGG